MIRIVIGSDLCPVNRSERLFMQSDASAIFHDLLGEFEQADLSIVNLECPLIKEPTPIVKTGPTLGANSDCVKGIQNARIDLVVLANNHIMDHGEKGLQNTMAVLTQAGIKTVGAGENLEQAQRIFIREVSGLRVGVLAMAEHEFSIAEDDRAGANPLDLIDFVRCVHTHQGEYDFLIVIIHGGNEYYPYPSPRVQKVSHFMVEQGARAVIWQHTHCPGCIETYRGHPIVYGQGNLVFDHYPNCDASWQEGFLVNLLIDESKNAQMEIAPYIQSDHHPGVRKMSVEHEQNFRGAIEQRSADIKDETFIIRQFREFCRKRRQDYLSVLYRQSRIERLLCKLFPFLNRLYSVKALRRQINSIRCESHRDVLETLLP